MTTLLILAEAAAKEPMGWPEALSWVAAYLAAAVGLHAFFKYGC